MNTAFIFVTLFEILFAAFIIWGIFNEEKLVRFEDKIRYKVKKGKKQTAEIIPFSENYRAS